MQTDGYIYSYQK